jgi:hypothetical protein
MASSSPNKALLARAAAILTTGEVAASSLDLNNAYGAYVTVDLDFTIGSLTNVTVRAYASVDGVTYKPISLAGTTFSEVLTATATRCYVFPPLVGWKFFRVSLQGSGTATSSSATVNYRYLQYGSQR